MKKALFSLVLILNFSIVFCQNNPNINALTNTKDFGEKLLKGSEKVSDNDRTFACMDSLCSAHLQSRDFYWQVFQVILQKSDGALSEVVGGYLHNYFKKYPAEFADRYNQLDAKLKSKCVHFAAMETYNDFEKSTEKEKYCNDLKKGCKKCSPKQLNILDKFSKAVLKEQF